MTKKKTSIEKLVTRNATVSEGHSALIATRWKWREVRGLVCELFSLIHYECGLCKLADLRKGEARGRCSNCQVNAKCHETQSTASNLEEGLDQMIDEVMKFLSELKGEELDQR